jgi:HlyD family secretion protein
MQRLRSLLVPLLVLGALIYGGLELRAFLDRPPTVEVAEVGTGDVRRVLAVTGRIRPRQRNFLVPAVRARLLELTREEGAVVRRGEVLARLDADDLEAELAGEETARKRLEDELEQARRDVERARRLAAEGLLSPSDLEGAELAAETAARRVEESLRRSEAIRARRDDYTLRSPLDGRVLERPVDPGQVVGPEDVLYELATDDEPWVEAEVDERYLAELRLGMPATIAPLAGRREAHPAEVVYIGRSIDRLSGAAIVRLAFTGDGLDLPAGASLDINLVVEEHPGVPTVPRAAVSGLGGGETWVLVVEGERAVRRGVQVIDWPAERLVVEGGLAAGERVVVEPRRTTPGAVIRPRQVDDGAE